MGMSFGLAHLLGLLLGEGPLGLQVEHDQEGERHHDAHDVRPPARGGDGQGRGDLSWLRTNGVNTNGAAAKVFAFDRLGKKVRPGTFGEIKVG